MIKVNLQYEWTPAPGRSQALDATLFRVLHAVADCGSLAEAARRLGVSYRHAWGLVGKWDKVFGRPVIELRQGHGAQLAVFAFLPALPFRTFSGSHAGYLDIAGHEWGCQ